MHGFIQICNQNLKGAIKTLEQVSKLQSDKDPDVLSLLAYCNHMRSENDIFSPQWEKAINQFLKAEIALQKLWLPTQSTHTNLAQMSEIENKQKSKSTLDKDESTHFRYWLVVLSANSYYKLSTKHPQEIQYLTCSLGSKAKNNDLVFFTREEKNKKTDINCRLSAIYNVSAPANWDPIEGYQNSIEMLGRFNYSLPLKLNTNKLDKVDSLDAKNRIDGLYQLDEENLKEIMKSIHEYQETTGFEISFNNELLSKIS